MSFDKEIYNSAHQYKCKNNLLVVAFGNSEYTKVILQWLLLLGKLNVSNYLIVSLDEKLYKLLSYFGYHAVRSDFSGSLGQFWTYRSVILKKILECGLNIVHSDADALWLKNPIPEYFSKVEFDILSSQGTIWPPEILEKWGFVLCSGLVYYRSSQKVIKIFDSLIKASAKCNDDQRAFNNILYGENINWSTDNIESYELCYKDKIFKCFKSVLRGEGESLNIGLLPHEGFQRLPQDDNGNIYVAHHLSAKNENAKIKLIDKLKLDQAVINNMFSSYAQYNELGTKE